MIRYLSIILTLLTFASTSFAGGTIPANYGMKQGSSRMIPSHPSILRYDYYGAQTPEIRDAIMWAAATLDKETLKYRILFGSLSELEGTSHTIVRLWASDAPVSAGCLPDNPADCVYAQATCLTYTTATAPYRLCSWYKITLNIANIQFRATERGIPFLEFLHAVVRHELAHALGFSHENMPAFGPMADGNLPFTACQKQMLEQYVHTESPTWTVVPSCLLPN